MATNDRYPPPPPAGRRPPPPAPGRPIPGGTLPRRPDPAGGQPLPARQHRHRAGALPTVRRPGGSAGSHDHARLKALILRTSRRLNRQWSAALPRVGIEWHAPGYAIAARRGRGARGDCPRRGGIVPYHRPRNTTNHAPASAMAGGSGASLGREGFAKNRTHRCNTWRAPAAAAS